MIAAIFTSLSVCFITQAGLEQIAASAQGKVGAAAMVLETGESVGLRADDQFPMQSVYKFPIAMTVLHQVDGGTLKLDQSIRIEKGELVPPGLHSPIRDEHPDGVEKPLREILRYAVEESDGTASDVLMRLAGGPPRVELYVKSLGVDGIEIATTEMQMSRGALVQYRNWATPNGMLKLLKVFEEGRGLSGASRALMMQWMTETRTGVHRIKGLLPAGTVVAHKTGTSGTAHGLTRATNDAGIVTLPDGRHMAIAVFVSDSKADEPTREGVIAQIAKAAWDAWSQAKGH